MLKLVEKSPAEGLVPLSVGTMELSEVVPAAITSIAYYQGQADALSAALKEHHGMALPKTGQATGRPQAGGNLISVAEHPHLNVRVDVQVCGCGPRVGCLVPRSVV